MNNQGPSYGLRKESIIETVDRLHREFLKTSIQTSSEALLKAYRMLADEQKIAFLLAGGAECVFQWQRQYLQTRPDRETGQLPVFC